jgi:hypothetical protein
MDGVGGATRAGDDGCSLRRLYLLEPRVLTSYTDPLDEDISATDSRIGGALFLCRA